MSNQGLELPFGIKLVNPIPVDYWSGPYSSVSEQTAIDDANTNIPIEIRFQSMEVRLIVNNVSKKFWYRDGISDGDLVEFSSSSVSVGGGIITVTKAEIDTLISSNDLIPLSTYEITGVDNTLYGGSTIYVQAINENTLTTDGIGKFFNPKYDQLVSGFNVWTSTGTYSIGDKVHWGGKTWESTGQGTGNFIDIFNLTENDWTVIPFNNTDYNVVYDVIKYDYANDVIVYRNEQNNNIVSTSYENIQEFLDYGFGTGIGNPIKSFMWGNVYKYDLEKGIGNQVITNSYNENINFRGSYQSYLIFNNNSYQYNLNFDNNSYQSYLTFDNGSNQNNLTFDNDSYQSYLTFNNSYQNSLTFDNNSSQNSLTFDNNSSQNSLTFDNSSSQHNLTFDNSSNQQILTFDNSSSQTNLIFDNNSKQSYLTATTGFSQNKIHFINYQFNRTLTSLTTNEEGLMFQGDLPISTTATKMIVKEDNQLKEMDILGGSSGIIIVTKVEIDTLISSNDLIPGTTYKITDVHADLYNDGTDSGTTIFLKALTNNKLSIEGSGLFYNPKYNQSVDGYGIWSNINSWTVIPSGTFSVNEQITANNGATGSLVGTIDSNFFISNGGTWSSAVSISGNISGATASISSIVLKSYDIDDTAIWGGYTWTNLNGNVGASIGNLSLNSEWEKIQYNETDYNISLDIIHYDYENDTIVYREDIAANIVHTTKAFNDLNNEPIKLFQWGNNFRYGNDEGVGSNLVKNSICDNVNFRGQQFIGNQFIDSYYQNNLFINDGYIAYNTFTYCSIYNNTFVNNTYLEYNILSNSYIYENSLDTSTIEVNTNIKATINNNILIISSFSGNPSLIGTISYNKFYNGALNSNTLINGSISDNTFNTSYLSSNALSYSAFNENTLTNCQIVDNRLSYSQFKKNILANEYLQLNIFDNVVIDTDVSTATILFSDYQKTVYARPDKIPKIRYYDNFDALVIADITD